MCLLAVAWQMHPQYGLILAANRDELHSRATAALDRWSEWPWMAAGRDLVAGGSWLAADERGRVAAVTNFRGEGSRSDSPRSRGRLVTDFLAGNLSAPDYLASVAPDAQQFPGFNMLLADATGLWYACNRQPQFARALGAGVYGLSNDLLDVAWPKVRRTRQGLRDVLNRGDTPTAELFGLLGERSSTEQAPPELPWPANSGAFVAHPTYGTRSCTVVLREAGSTLLHERRFGPNGAPTGETQLRLRHSP